MKITETKVFKGKNIYSLKKCIRLDVDLEGYSETPSSAIEDFSNNLVNMLPELKTHRCGIDEEGGFVKRLYEGTYLAHICEHIIIALQNKLGIDVSYGKAREIEGDRYYIVFQYVYENFALETAKLAVDIINALINKVPINYDERIKLLDKILKDEMMGPSTRSICEYAEKLGLPVIRLGKGDFYQIGYGKQGRIIEASIGSNTNCVGVDISCDKLLTKELLNIHNIPVAKGSKVNNILDLLQTAEKIGYPVVLKPQYGNKGKGVILNIKNEKELLRAYSNLIKKYKDIIIEKYHKGRDYRVCVINYEVVAASLRIPPYVVGNGKNTIRELIDILNSNPERGNDHEKNLTKIKIDKEVINYIREQGKSLDDILEKNKKIFLRKNANLSTGGEAIDCTDIICEENKKICIRAAKALKLDICGIDICTEDISKPIIDNENINGIIMEVNAAPGLRMHLNPSKGKARDIGKYIVNMLYNNNPVNIPVVSITGTNGKTTTTRLISHTLQKMGYCTGMTSTDGIFINNEVIDIGDDTGFHSARSVLLNPDVDVAVLETARGGIIRNGLAYDAADVAVITNIREDHLGVDNINTMEELCFVKSLVGEAVKEDGYVVINAEDYWSRTILDRIKAKKIFFSIDSNNDLLLKNKSDSICVYVEKNEIVASNKNKIYKICNVNDVPITLNGKLKFNIENTLAACSALIGLNIDYSMIRNGITSYQLNSKENLGRFNWHNVNGVNVILDYGHNIDGYKAVLSSIKKLTNNKLYGVIGIPGDRKDDVAIKIGKISSQFLDYLIIKEDRNLRGRKRGEIARLIEKGVKLYSNNKKYEIILSEEKAFKKAISLASKGDYIVVFYEKLEPLINIIEGYKNEKIVLKA
ncbi:cyanophycin synthetase [Caproiciproducens sp. MSJ-32]|uniref:cyanophycin synthetase n=1 Tax=Caproiciproducens sp. MSJ-32 TaxID=2841527 RepID=UPI001C11C539|nr:cyanophycin synthetase [Caproiciproducens sp. MSJ-32]MBU5456034.1 cyanophycin synthetase [Caproiciproducens sp. MSJ-32]